MHPKHRILFVFTALAFAAAATGCISKSDKLRAVNTVTVLQTGVDQNLTAELTAIEALTRRNLELQRQYLRERWLRSKAELTIDIHRRFDAELAVVVGQISSNLNARLGPIEGRLTAAIAEQERRGSAGKAAADSLRLELSASLAIFQREGAKLELQTTEKLSAARTKVLGEIERYFADEPDAIRNPPTDKQLADIMTPYKTKVEEFRRALQKSSDGLREFVALDSPAKLAFEGLVGASAYNLVQGGLDKVLNQAETELTKKVDGFGRRILDDLATKGLRI